MFITIHCPKHKLQECREISPTSVGCEKCFPKGKIINTKKKKK